MDVRNLFQMDERLGIRLPKLEREWEDYPEHVRQRIIEEWEDIRGSIPDRIRAFESLINDKQERLSVEPEFAACCRLNAEIADLASRINDLHIWFRIDQTVDVEKRHA